MIKKINFNLVFIFFVSNNLFSVDKLEGDEARRFLAERIVEMSRARLPGPKFRVIAGEYKSRCRICDMMVVPSYEDSHIKMHLGNREFSCDKCRIGFVSVYGLRDHISKSSEHVATDDQKKNKCSMCGHRFFTIKNLNIHKRQEIDQKIIETFWPKKD